jgi:endonuclease VIII
VPEGDTVYRAAHKLAAALVGDEVTRFDIRVPRSAVADLRGERVTSVIARGKHLLERIGEYTLHSHLKMEGRWDVYRPGERWRRPAFSARAVVGTARAETVGFDLAQVEVLPTADEQRVVGHLGPDPLGPDWDAAEAARRVGADPRAAHVAILDQRSVAGFGNVYANEMLFVRGIAPARPATEIDAVALIDLGARMIRANRDRPERTFTGDARPGQRFWVYGREGKPCRRCGTLIRAGSLGSSATSERNVFWCPACQAD